MPERKVKIESQTEIPNYWYEDRKVFKDSYLFIVSVEGIARPISVVIPKEEYTEEKLKMAVEAEVKKEEEKKPPVIKEFTI